MNFVIFILALAQLAGGAFVFFALNGAPATLVAAVLFGSGSVTLAVSVVAIRLTEANQASASRT